MLKIEKTNGYQFALLEKYFVNLLDFEFSDQYFKNSMETYSVYFPYLSEYRQYQCMIVIEDFIDIKINFNIGVSDKLYGDCSDSKYCLYRSKL